MKPSEQFADLRKAADELSSVDRLDLLALLKLADRQFDIIKEFGNCKHKLDTATRKMNNQLKEIMTWRRSRGAMIEVLHEKDKVVPLRKEDDLYLSKSR